LLARPAGIAPFSLRFTPHHGSPRHCMARTAPKMPCREATSKNQRTITVRRMYAPADTLAFRVAKSVAQKVHF